ncbi:MAG: nucleotidyltransferase family protein [Gemmataceae bacterium]|nr:nucleotidyltransferase family protein [Gemmataceae bacterium]
MPTVVPYEQRLKADFRWALREGSMHFEQESGVQKTLTAICRKLDGLGVPYAVVGGMALFYHGYRRFTEDVDILVNRESLPVIHGGLEGLGYLPPFAGSKNLRDTETGVRIEFLVAGDYPGDGLPKPVAFPDPAAVGVEIAGLRFLALPTLVELKLASGMSSPRRAKDLVDVQELIGALNLGDEMADRLNPYVRAKYLELVRVVRDNPEPPA